MKIFEDPYFLLKVMKLQGLSFQNYNDWIGAIQLTQNTALGIHAAAYIKRAVVIEHGIDIPCHINADIVARFLPDYNFSLAVLQRDLGMLQALTPMISNSLHFRFDGATPMTWACRNEYFEVVKVLAPLYKNPNIPVFVDGSKHTPIYEIVMFGNIETLKFLAPLTNSPNAAEFYNWTPIHLGVALDRTEFVRYLASLTAQPNALNGMVRSPVQMAREGGNAAIIQILESYNDDA